jgi:hypothetical protein
MNRTVSKLSFETHEAKTSFMMDVLQINHDNTCCLELINDSEINLEIHLLGSIDEIIIKQLEKLYGQPLIFNQCNVQ